ncbi:MAG: 5,6-dimethylbenzimidazole synthase [Alicyclobacillus sp.]|nr:5,6-dimethylbenzimidazole synthase [Alicyclobacillus sp.]
MAETATFGDARVSNPHRAEHEPLGPGEARVESPAATGAECTDGAANRSAAVQPTANDFDEAERQALYKAIYARRDIRSFLPDSIDDEVLMRILAAAHHGPSVGFMQPWNFILVRDRQVLREIQRVVERERVLAAEHYEDLQRDYYLRLKVEGLLQAPLTICVTNDPTRGGPHVLGRNTIPETDLMSTACAIENLWLAARVEGIGVGWVSIYQKADIRRILRIPERIDPVALLSIGYTAHFPEIPLLERVGWRSRLALQGLIYHDFWGNEEVQSP